VAEVPSASFTRPVLSGHVNPRSGGAACTERCRSQGRSSRPCVTGQGGARVVLRSRCSERRWPARTDARWPARSSTAARNLRCADLLREGDHCGRSRDLASLCAAACSGHRGPVTDSLGQPGSAQGLSALIWPPTQLVPGPYKPGSGCVQIASDVKRGGRVFDGARRPAPGSLAPNPRMLCKACTGVSTLRLRGITSGCGSRWPGWPGKVAPEPCETGRADPLPCCAPGPRASTRLAGAPSDSLMPRRSESPSRTGRFRDGQGGRHRPLGSRSCHT
jgi:hypothetical protein